MTEVEVENTRQRYIDILKPLFLPDDPISNDIIQYFASLLRVVGMEDKGWDPHLESRSILEDINAILQSKHSKKIFPDLNFTTWRMGLLMYSHIVEMDAPYEVITNLLRFRLGKGYSPNPYYTFLNSKEKKQFERAGLYPSQKIKIIKILAKEAGSAVGSIFDEFYDSNLRNAISHSDYILTKKQLRVRNGTGAFGAYSIPLKQLNETITKSKLFISTFFGLDISARTIWGAKRQQALPYDQTYKGLLEILADNDNLMCGFKIHWPNNSESVYRRTQDGIDMTNCMLDLRNSCVEFMVGLYARTPGNFSSLVEVDSEPIYTPIEGTGETPVWNL